jgi:hypothetical protein
MAAGSAYQGDPKDTVSEPARSGWITFAGAFLALAGVMNAIWGLSAITNNDLFHEGSLLWRQLTFWGWLGLLTGVAQAVTGGALLMRKAIAGLLAVLLAMLGILLHFLALGAYPIWSVILIVANALVIYAVTAGADELD